MIIIKKYLYCVYIWNIFQCQTLFMIVFYKNWTIFNLCQKKNYIILNFNYPMVNTFLVIFLKPKTRIYPKSDSESLFIDLAYNILNLKKKKK